MNHGYSDCFKVIVYYFQLLGQFRMGFVYCLFSSEWIVFLVISNFGLYCGYFKYIMRLWVLLNLYGECWLSISLFIPLAGNHLVMSSRVRSVLLSTENDLNASLVFRALPVLFAHHMSLSGDDLRAWIEFYILLLFLKPLLCFFGSVLPKPSFGGDFGTCVGLYTKLVVCFCC